MLKWVHLTVKWLLKRTCCLCTIIAMYFQWPVFCWAPYTITKTRGKSAEHRTTIQTLENNFFNLNIKYSFITKYKIEASFAYHILEGGWFATHISCYFYILNVCIDYYIWIMLMRFSFVRIKRVDEFHRFITFKDIMLYSDPAILYSTSFTIGISELLKRSLLILALWYY